MFESNKGTYTPSSQPKMMKLPPVVQRIENQTAAANPVPICVLVVGMAGSGKTTLMEQLQQSTIIEDDNNSGETAQIKSKIDTTTNGHGDDANDQKPAAAAITAKTTAAEDTTDNTSEKKKAASDTNIDSKDSALSSATATLPAAYCINLDPAVLDVSYSPSIDIRDTVDYKQVMQQHRLGPNGAIMTSLNLYATKFDQVIHLLEKRYTQGEMSDYILVDTPGQIEAFTWSASGQIFTESLASTFPTVMVFVVDTVRCVSSPNTFMSNMLYACSMYYRSRLPLVICFNKIDVVSHQVCIEWMKDFDAFQDALDSARENSDSGNHTGFYDSLTRSLSLVLDEFYTEFSKNAVGVSAITGDGVDDFWNVVKQAASVDFQDYIEDLKHRIEEQEAKQQAIARIQARRLHRDVNNDQEEEEEEEEEEDDDDE